MSCKVNLVAVQMTSTPNPEENLNWLEGELRGANLVSNSIVVLPECFSCFGGGASEQLKYIEHYDSGHIYARLLNIAEEFKCHLFAGSVPLASATNNKFYAACRYIDGSIKGEAKQRAIYNKMHLFDVSVGDNTGNYCESDTTLAGEDIVVIDVDGLRVGVAICYDIRFSALFDAMGAIDVLVLPAAFTEVTGKAHWEVLLRARAIEKQCFVVAAGQVGRHCNGRETFGHSMIVSPWGEILVQQTHTVGVVQKQVDMQSIANIRASMPVYQHAKFRSDFVK